MRVKPLSCISYHFYIKPQPGALFQTSGIVVYLIISTSNHNLTLSIAVSAKVVYLIISTSNHNLQVQNANSGLVVYLIISTSNHNPLFPSRTLFQCCISYHFYIKPQPGTRIQATQARCISYHFYIKPQLL